MFRNFYSKRVKKNDTDDTQNDKRVQILSLAFYIQAYIECIHEYNGQDHNINDIERLTEPSSFDKLSSTLESYQYLFSAYQVDKKEQKITKHAFMQGASDYLTSLKLDSHSKLRYLHLKHYKTYLKQQRLALKNIDKSALKQMLIHLIDYASTHKKASVDNNKAALINHFLQKTAESLGLSNIEFQNLLGIKQTIYQQQHKRKNASNLYPEEYIKACFILSVEQNTKFEDIKRQYSRLMRQNHPDKLASKKLSSDKIHQATELVKEYQLAYKIIKNYHTN